MNYDPYSQDDDPRQRNPHRSHRQGGYDDQEQDGYDPRLRQRSRMPEEAPPQEEQVPFGQGGPSIGGGLLSVLLRNPKVLIALVMAVGAFISYQMMPTEKNDVTGETYKIPWEPAQDVPLGLQARDEMMAQHGGEHPDQRLQATIDRIGMRLVQANAKGNWADEFSQYKWDFHLLRDPQTINAFALPGGQVFFTYGLFSKLKSEDEVAGVMGHEIGHVIARHSAKQVAKNKLIGGVANAGSILMSDGQSSSGQMAQVIGSMVSMKYGREDESQSDELGVQFMVNAGYKPEGLIGVMEVLNDEMGGNRQPEFMSTHPNPENRIEKIKAAIEAVRSGQLPGPREVREEVEGRR